MTTFSASSGGVQRQSEREREGKREKERERERNRMTRTLDVSSPKYGVLAFLHSSPKRVV
jgi:hypothetical protein